MILLHSYIDIKDSYIDIKGGPFLGIVNMLVFWQNWSFNYWYVFSSGFIATNFCVGNFMPFSQFFMTHVDTCSSQLSSLFCNNHIWIGVILLHCFC